MIYGEIVKPKSHRGKDDHSCFNAAQRANGALDTAVRRQWRVVWMCVGAYCIRIGTGVRKDRMMEEFDCARL
jgi:hypothetical protein